MICSQSNVLKAICGAEFKESQTNTIDFSSEVQAFIEAMPLFLYRGDYPDIDVAPVEDESHDFETFRIEPNDDATIHDQSHIDQPDESVSIILYLSDSDSDPSEIDKEAQAQYCHTALHKLSELLMKETGKPASETHSDPPSVRVSKLPEH